MKEHRKEVEQEGRKYTGCTKRVTIGAEQIGYHRPRQHRESRHQLGRANSHCP